MLNIEDVFTWIGDAATGGIYVLQQLATGVSDLILTPGSAEAGPTLTFFGVLTIAGVGGPLAFKFIKYIISLFKKVKIN